MKYCLYCSRSFMNTNSVSPSNWNERKYCSPQCAVAARKVKKEEKNCEVCGITMPPNTHLSLAKWEKTKYCSSECYGITKRHTKEDDKFCLQCSKEITKSIKNGWKTAKYCSLQCYTDSKQAPAKLVGQDGYVGVFIDKDSPYFSMRGGCGRNRILEHRLVVAQSIERCLFPEETVHHINGDKQDNRLNNLELWSSRHPKGQRVEDKIAWAKELLALYEPEALRAQNE